MMPKKPTTAIITGYLRKRSTFAHGTRGTL
ncbi:hypothetical protein FHS11_005162 [Mucilaginibacter gotjawali]|uniref:Uncharacterized protein n=1 Tax=Mucilaginibacter gotjawali TaxID=1550579 RepID=A0A839SN97_9SPHI|nr:hypothetical protein [Mucilaginibacter gotjawali]